MSTTCDFGSLPASVAWYSLNTTGPRRDLRNDPLSDHPTRIIPRGSSHADYPTRIIPRGSSHADYGSWIRASGSGRADQNTMSDFAEFFRAMAWLINWFLSVPLGVASASASRAAAWCSFF